MKKIYFRALVLLIMVLLTTSAGLWAQTVITDASIGAGESLTLTSDQEWVLDGNVFVEEGATLNIEAGTVIKGRTVATTGDLTSALIIARGGKIMAEGTADNPIIFTAEIDDLSSTSDLTANDVQLWGGLIILGNAPIGEDDTDLDEDDFGDDVIEGIPSDELRGRYGGNDPMDNSGVLKYVSIRHGGAVLGADNEIQGLSLGGVGAGTTIDYIEIFANFDDGIEFFGGTVNVTHAVVGFVGDDSYDFDESYNGYLQYILAVQGELDGQGDKAIEYDGTESSSGEPNEAGRIYNGTFIGAGSNASNPKSGGLDLKSNGHVQIWNSIFVDQVLPVYNFQTAVDESAIASNIAFGFNTLSSGDLPSTFDVSQEDPLLGVSRQPNSGLDPRPALGSPALSGAATTTEQGVEATSFIGAFDGTTNWALSWTALDAYGYFDQSVEVDYKSNETGLSLSAQSPSIGNTAVYFNLPSSGDAKFNVFDLSGKRVFTKIYSNLTKGDNQLVQLELAHLNSGYYFITLESNDGIVSNKFIITK